MKYIRTKDTIFIGNKNRVGAWEVNAPYKVFDRDIVAKANTIDDLIRDDDILYIHDLYPDTVLVVEGNIKPFGYNERILLKDWLEYDWTVFDLYIKNNHDDYIKVASKKSGGKLELL